MKRIVSIAGAALALTFAAGAFAGCSGGSVPLEYRYYKSELDEYGNVILPEYDHDKVYENDLPVRGADPSAIYITEGEEKGYYYMYNTSDPIGATGYLAYRSRNLNDWECMGVAYNPAMYMEDDVVYSCFSRSNFWAPEVIYDEDMGMYLMFYNAAYIFEDNLKFYIDVAVSESPQGPFTQYAKWKYETGTPEEKTKWAPVEDNASAVEAGLGAGKLKIFMPLVNFAEVPAPSDGGTPDDPSDDVKIDESWSKGDPLRDGELPGYMKVIDASPFIDEDGEKYLYFVQDLGGLHGSSAVCVMKMNDDWTPDYTQLKKLTAANRIDLGSDPDSTLMENNVNEAPFMVRHGDTYYLMFSVCNYGQTSYAVRVATGSSPMGPFKKLTKAQGGYLLYREGPWVSGTGHHSFVTTDDATYIVYHAHTDRRLGGTGSARAIAFDEIKWITNAEGTVIPHANGPTYSHMPLTTAEWKNIAPEAKVESTNIAEGSDVKYLTDGIIKIHNDVSTIHEFEMAPGAATITLTFDGYREISGLFLVNASTYDLSVGRISQIEFVFDANGSEMTAYTDALQYDYDRYYPGNEYYVKGGTFALSFNPMKVKSIKITLPTVEEARAFSEIMVLGK